MSAGQCLQAFASVAILGGLHACAADHIQQPLRAKCLCSCQVGQAIGLCLRNQVSDSCKQLESSKTSSY